MTAFNYMYSEQVVQVQCTVTNEIGEIASDIYEFYINESPVVGNTTISVLDGNGNGTALSSIYNITLANWYDSSTISTIKYKIYMQVDTDYLLVSDQYTDATNIYLTIPPFSNS